MVPIKGNFDILLIEKDELLLKNNKVADVFNSYFLSIFTDCLDLFQWPLESTDQIYDSVDRNIDSFRAHSGTKNIRRNYKITSKSPSSQFSKNL